MSDVQVCFIITIIFFPAQLERAERGRVAAVCLKHDGGVPPLRRHNQAPLPQSPECPESWVTFTVAASWLRDLLTPILRLMGPIDFHITSDGIQEHYTFDSWLSGKMDLHKAFEKYGVPKRRRAEYDGDEPECGCGCDNISHATFIGDIIKRFHSLVIDELNL